MENTKKNKFFDLLIVLGISLLPIIITALYRFCVTRISYYPEQLNLKLISSITHEVLSILLLFYVLVNRGKTYKDLGIIINVKEILIGIGVFICAYIMYYISYYLLRSILPGSLLQELTTKNVDYLTNFTWLLALYIVINPFFEELIVRGFAITEIYSLTNSKIIAVVISTLLQSTYHLYQGIFPTLLMTFTFLFYSIYYIKTGKLTPIIIAHLIFDLLILFRIK